jgi:hypothetical protein
MPDSAGTSVRFASCASKAEVLEAVFCLLGAVAALMSPGGWMAAVPLAVGVVWLWMRARSDRSQPYVELSDGRLIVHEGRVTTRQVDMRSLIGVRRGWNRTILLLSDGTKVGVGHMGFTTSEEADRFHKWVENATGVKQA